jgi:DNA-binding MarR family transcriptional regulator
MKTRKQKAPSAVAPPEPAARPAPQLQHLSLLYEHGGTTYLGYRLVLAAKLFDRAVARLLAQHSDLTLPQWRVMSQLGLVDEATIRSMSETAAVDRAEVSRAVQRLEQRGLVRRRPNPADRRSPLFGLTASGRRLYATVRQPIIDFVGGITDPLGKRRVDVTNQALWAFTQACLVPDGKDPE